MTVTIPEPTFQARLQNTVLQLIAGHRCAHPAAVAIMCPHTDARDLRRALELLLEGGELKETDASPVPVEIKAGMKGCLRLTETGRSRLADGPSLHRF